MSIKLVIIELPTCTVVGEVATENTTNTSLVGNPNIIPNNLIRPFTKENLSKYLPNHEYSIVVEAVLRFNQPLVIAKTKKS